MPPRWQRDAGRNSRSVPQPFAQIPGISGDRDLWRGTGLLLLLFGPALLQRGSGVALHLNKGVKGQLNALLEVPLVLQQLLAADKGRAGHLQVDGLQYVQAAAAAEQQLEVAVVDRHPDRGRLALLAPGKVHRHALAGALQGRRSEERRVGTAGGG